ncbi:hypothetical protein AERO8C_70299 [Aeromonas veronii]|uniref:Uncharacterized protein n=1 Tax=Aeromonas veronii TaxID=654 RepID=A0A653LBF1_AERVE|nr:hypothetical protein AERO8C_70299 [Aeromonas veronii]
MVAVVAVTQGRPVGGGNSAGHYGGRIYLRERPITPDGKLHQPSTEIAIARLRQCSYGSCYGGR